MIIGLGSGGLILFRQLRKGASDLMTREARAQYMATHDELTQLPNKKLFVRRLIAIDNHHVIVTQPTRAAARAITDLAHDALAAHLEADPFGRFDQLVQHAFGARIVLLTHPY